jgi:RND family efflux transporter MFP subunit
MRKRTTRRWKRPDRTGVGVALALAAIVAATGCAREIGSDASAEDDGAAPPARATVAMATPAVEGERSFSTNLYSERDADLYNRLLVDENTGVGIPVTSIRVEVGDRVAEGQVLATLEDEDARLEVEAAEPEAEIAAANLRRVEELAKSGAVSEAEREDALLRSRTADAALAKARLNLSRTQIRAPFAGVISRRYVRVGDVVDDRTPLFRVTALAPLRARLLVPESEVDAFEVGAPVTLTAADGSRETARVLLVGPTIDAGSGTREVIVELRDVGAFRPGASATAELGPAAGSSDEEEPRAAATGGTGA